MESQKCSDININSTHISYEWGSCNVEGDIHCNNGEKYNKDNSNEINDLRIATMPAFAEETAATDKYQEQTKHQKPNSSTGHYRKSGVSNRLHQKHI